MLFGVLCSGVSAACKVIRVLHSEMHARRELEELQVDVGAYRGERTRGELEVLAQGGEVTNVQFTQGDLRELARSRDGQRVITRAYIRQVAREALK